MIRLININSFVEQVGRRRTHKSNPTMLDTLDCIFIGPASLASDIVPRDLAVHPEFTGMQCSGWEILEKEAALAEMRAQYTGKLTGGSGTITTEPVITRSRHLGEVSYTNQFPTSSTQIETLGYSVRFTAKGVSFKYLTNRVPPANFSGQFRSRSNQYVGIENLQTFQTSRSFETGASSGSSGSGFGGYISSRLSFSNDLTDLQVNDLSNGWWEVSEVYMAQPHISTGLA